MTRRGEDAKARAKRHRAAIANRSQSASRRTPALPQPPGPAEMGITSSWVPPAVATAVVPPAGRTLSRQSRLPGRRDRTRKPSPAAIRDAVEQLRALVIQREAATVAVDREVNRLRWLGACWPDIAQALGVSRQAARQKYRVRGQP